MPATRRPPGARRPRWAPGAAPRVRGLGAAAVGRVRAAGQADGAAESGLSRLLTVNALHMGGDAMVAVSLAGTLFFTAPADAQRGNVALYLLVTMAPFAVLAPLIGPALDRLHRGRRWALAAGLFGRAALALVLAAHHDDLLLYPAALAVLVLSRAHNVLRAAVVPRVLPPALPLTSANARLSVFALVTAAVLGAAGAGLVALLGLAWELWATAAVFTAAGVLAVRLPRRVEAPDVAAPAVVLPAGGRRGRPAVGPHVTTALRAQACLRGLAGFLTVYSAFVVQAAFADGWAASLALATVAVAAAGGSVAGTGIGSRLRTTTPDRVVLVCAGTAALVAGAAAVLHGLAVGAVVVAVAAVTNALGKVALDAVVQREVPEHLRASAFARAETALQLAWVAGGALGIAVPPSGRLGPGVAAGLLALAVAGVLAGALRGRARAAEVAR